MVISCNLTPCREQMFPPRVDALSAAIRVVAVHEVLKLLYSTGLSAVPLISVWDAICAVAVAAL